jgi:copper/silver efflux system protein
MKRCRLPGVTNAWVMPIRTRIDMLATGIRTPVGIKVAGADLAVIQEIGERIEEVIKGVPGTSSVYSERVTGGRYHRSRGQPAHGGPLRPQRGRCPRGDPHRGGRDEHRHHRGRAGALPHQPPLPPRPARFPGAPAAAPPGQPQRRAWLALEQVATVAITDGPPMIRSENARLSGWTYIDIQGRDLGGYVAEAPRRRGPLRGDLPPGYSIGWSGQYEHLERAKRPPQTGGAFDPGRSSCSCSI